MLMFATLGNSLVNTTGIAKFLSIKIEKLIGPFLTSSPLSEPWNVDLKFLLHLGVQKLNVDSTTPRNMLLTSIMGVSAALFAAVAAHPAPSPTSVEASTTSSMDAIHASTQPSTQALYHRVYRDALFELLNVSSSPAFPVVSTVPPRRLKPHFKVELVNDITSKAVRQLLPPTSPFRVPPNMEFRPLPSENFNWSNAPSFDVGPQVAPMPIPSPAGSPPPDGIAPTIVERSETKDVRATMLEHAEYTGLPESDMVVLERTIDDAQEIVYAAQIRATNMIHEREQAYASNDKRRWCISRLFGGESCSGRD
ncbi:hypothetical protein DE146DRAFT_781093 [Phaeosphaeria sp. MPI-PUGE-AT-0046c]|nr:hypothetical protein DE146DRAFT_781093 [Phaeosphaeria sp. MPI-PUGE-AT-0046c]